MEAVLIALLAGVAIFLIVLSRVVASGLDPVQVRLQQIAVRPSERGFLAFVVIEGLARERILTLGMRTAEGLEAIRSGLQPGEALVVRGAEALYDGATVKVSGAAPAQEAKR